jgi:hypothetical protein
MAKDVQLLFELSKKLRRLQDWAAQSDICSLRSEHEISKSTDIPRSTLKSNLNQGRMSVANQQKLAELFGFSIDWPEWRDQDASRDAAASKRRDTAGAFNERFLRRKSQAARLTIEAGPTRKHIDRRFADFSLSVAGSFSPSPAIEQIPLMLSLSFDRRGWPVLFEETNDVITVGLTEVDLQLFADRSTARISALPIECHGTSEGNFEGRVDGFPHWWTIRMAEQGALSLAGSRLRNDGQDCICEGFQAGDTIRAVMTARVDKCFVRLTGEPFEHTSEARIRFIKHLTKLHVLNDAEAMLGEQLLTVIDKI